MNKLRLAGAIIYNKKGKILLIHRNARKVQWELPGGKIDKDETPKQTAKRELLEEIGIEIKVIKKIGEHSFTEDGFEMDYVWLLAEIESGEIKLVEKGFDDFRYFSWNELRNNMSPLSANVKNLVNAYFSKKI